MALETLCSNELLNFIIYDTISATPFTSNDSTQTITAATNPCNTFLFHLQNSNPNPNLNSISPRVAETATAMEIMSSDSTLITTTAKMSMAVQSYCNRDDNNSYVNLGVQKKKRRRSSRVCKNKEEAETQRMTHIAVERNRRKQMNEHLAVLRSLMPESYVQRGDQASIVGGAIEFVKELEHLLQTLEAQKYQEQEVVGRGEDGNFTNISGSTTPPPFSQFFTYPQYTSCQIPNKYTSKSKAAIADIEVTLIETHANVRILSRKRLAQLSKMVACFQTLHLSVLHINVTTLDPLVLYSISVKVEEGCRLNSADEIAGAVHHMLRIIEEEAAMPLSFVDSIN